MMHLKLYKLKECDDFKIDKVNYLTLVGNELTGDLKENCDISSPVFTIKCPKDTNSNNIIDYNYCYITEFKRYYFINSITFGMNDIITLSCTCDVLYSFKDIPTGTTLHWMNSYMYCTRRTNGDSFIKDEQRGFKYNKVITDVTSSIPVVATQPYTIFDVSNRSLTSRNVVLSVLNNVNWALETSPISATLPSYNKFPSATRFTNGEQMSTMYYLLDFDSLNGLMQLIYTNNVILSYIKAITILPFQPESIDLVNPTEEHPEGVPFNTIHIGEQTYTMRSNVGFIKYQNYYRFIKEKRDIPSATSFRDYLPYKSLKWYVPYKDYVELDMDSVNGCRLSLLYYINFDDSTASVILYNETRDVIEYQSVCQLGVKFATDTTNQRQINDENINMSIKASISTIASIIAMVGGAASGNPMMVAGGFAGIGATAFSTLGQANAMHVKGETSIASGMVGSLCPQDTSLIEIKYVPVIADGTPIISGAYTSDKGLPFNSYLAISNASSDEFLVFDDDNIPMDNRMTKNEFNTLIELLKKGVRK